MKRRFIAGALCPACRQLDKIVMYDDAQKQRWQECVACGFREMLVENDTPAAPARMQPEGEVVPVRIVDNSKK